jgi:hypothetical protein
VPDVDDDARRRDQAKHAEPGPVVEPEPEDDDALEVLGQPHLAEVRAGRSQDARDERRARRDGVCPRRLEADAELRAARERDRDPRRRDDLRDEPDVVAGLREAEAEREPVVGGVAGGRDPVELCLAARSRGDLGYRRERLSRGDADGDRTGSESED